jgi:biopolymer transport protein ExbD
MRRFSQRNPLVTLSDINITPLLDLAFVLLIIFIITTPLLENSLDLKLPVGGLQDKRKPAKDDIRTVEISDKGVYQLNGRKMSIGQLTSELVQDHRKNPNLTVDIRADKSASWAQVFAVFDACTRNGISRVSPRAAPFPRP